MPARAGVALTGFAAVALLMSGCGSSSDSGGDGGGEYRLGLVASSSGPFASNSKVMVKGANYAVQQLNAKGGINGHKVKFTTVDVQNNPSSGVTLVPKLVTESKVFAIVGPVDSAGCDIVCNTANKLKVPLVSPGAGRPGVLDKARPYAFSITQPDAANSTPVLKRIIAQKQFKTAAIITDDANATTKAQADLFATVFAEANVQVVKRATFTTGDSSFSAQITSIGSAKPDVLALAAGPDDAGRIAQEARSQHLTVTFLGTGSLQSGGAAYYAAGGKATEGTYAAAQYDPTNPSEPAKSLLAAAEKASGLSPIPLNFAYAYDAVNMIAKVIKDKGIEPDDSLAEARVKIQEGLNDLGPYSGMSGTSTFGPDGTAKRPELLSVMRGGRFVIDRTSGS